MKPTQVHSRARARLGVAVPRVALAVTLVAAFACGPAHAGNQKEEALADSVRLALSNAINDARPPKPVFRDEAARLRYQQWFNLSLIHI
mgnify:CR=1 FL=1